MRHTRPVHAVEIHHKSIKKSGLTTTNRPSHFGLNQSGVTVNVRDISFLPQVGKNCRITMSYSGLVGVFQLSETCDML